MSSVVGVTVRQQEACLECGVSRPRTVRACSPYHKPLDPEDLRRFLKSFATSARSCLVELRDVALDSPDTISPSIYACRSAS